VVAILNLVLGGLNLVPAYPLDGGRIVRAIAWRRTRSERRGWLAAARSGRLSGAAAAAAGLVVLLLGDAPNGLMIALSGWFLTLSARSIGDRVRVEDLVGELRVEDVMERDPATVHPGLTIDTFASQLLLGESTITAVPVVEGAELVGMLGVRQVRAIREDKWSETRVEDVMVPRADVPSVRPRDRLLVATESLQRSNLDGVPVLDEGRLVGVFTRRSLGVAVAARQGEAVAEERRPDGGGS
jgi:CBS domain-containing protein